MAKLYPPYLEDSIPSFYSVENLDSSFTTKITIPFSLNRSVGISDIDGFCLKVKTVQTNRLIGTYIVRGGKISDVVESKKVIFDVPKDLFTIGQFYKVQLAFINRFEEVGYFSSTSIVKYTTKPLITINGLNSVLVNNHNYNYVGVYSQKDGDSTEKMVSCRFILQDSEGVKIADSGEIIHHTYNDSSQYESHETFVIPEELKENRSYYLIFTAKTNNGMVVSSPRYRVIKAATVLPDMEVSLIAEPDFDNAYISLVLKDNREKTKQGDAPPKKITGMFYIVRAASNDGYAWREMGNFTLEAEVPVRSIWKDYTVEQGVHYIYGIQQYNKYGLRSDRIESNKVTADFEDSFLFDGERQLKLRFNSKVSSIKREIMEQKVSTIGSQYPFIFKNGSVNYYEFPISGLISYLGDENEEFVSLKELGIKHRTAAIDSDVMAAERLFKFKVLDWLMDGKPKIFKSPAEGNFIVRLLNVSLTPDDVLGRMIHSFQSTACEVAKMSYLSLKEKGFVKINSDLHQVRKQTVRLAGVSHELDLVARSIQDYYQFNVNMQLTNEIYNRIMNAGINISDSVTSLFLLNLSDKYIGKVKPLSPKLVHDIAALGGKVTYATGQINSRVAYSVTAKDLRPGTIIKIDGESVVVGASGSYEVHLPQGIKSIELPLEQPYIQNGEDFSKTFPTGLIDYTYYSDMSNVFDLYANSSLEDYPSKIWIGPPKRKKYNPYRAQYETFTDIINDIEDVKTTIVKIFGVKFRRRETVLIFYDGGNNYYYDMERTNKVDLNALDPYKIYRVCKKKNDFSYLEHVQHIGWYNDLQEKNGLMNEGGQVVEIMTDMCILGDKKEPVLYDEIEYYFSVGDGKVVVGEEGYSIHGDDLRFSSIEIGLGVVCEMSFQTRVMDFSAEYQEFHIVKIKRDLYDKAKENLEDYKKQVLLMSEIDKIQPYDKIIDAIKKSYEDLVTYVSIAKKDFEEETKL